MGDRLATIDIGRKLGAVPLLRRGELDPHVTQCGPSRGLPSHQVASWFINRRGPKIGAVPLFSGKGLGPNPAQCGLGRGLPPYQVASWSIQPFRHNRCGPRIGALRPFLGPGELGSHLAQCGLAEAYLHTKWHLDPFIRLATIYIGRKLGSGCSGPFLVWGARSSSNTLLLGPTPTSLQVASWSKQPFCDNRYGLKIGGWVPLGRGSCRVHM